MLTQIRKIFKNTLFRLSLLGALLFVVSMFVSLGYIYFATISSELRRVDKSIIAEIQGLQDIYDKEGLLAVNREVILRMASNEGLYYLKSRTGLSGNLEPADVDQSGIELFGIVPDEGGTPFRLIKFTYSVPDSDVVDLRDRRVRALAGFLKYDEKDKIEILVGRDVEATMRTSDRIKNAIITSSILALILGLISSWFVSRRFTSRIEDFNRLATDVRSGHLDRRAPRNFSEDELDLLAEHLNAMLDHINRLMGAMRYAGDSIAHDLRSPLTRLRTRLESAAVDVKNEQASDALFSAAEDAGQLLKTFDSVLRIARLEAGERRELLVELNPKQIMDDMVELYEPACEDVGLTFSSDISEKTAVRADRGLVSQAVSNLVENAIKYTPEGGHIHLSLERNRDGRVEIAITDNGPGIPADERQRVKERFVRLDKSRSAPGSGLGLALVDAVADLHRAKFELEDGIASEFGPGLSAKLVFPKLRQGQSAQKAHTVPAQ